MDAAAIEEHLAGLEGGAEPHYVTPAIEAHHKVLVHVPAADDDDVRRALTAAWELQSG